MTFSWYTAAVLTIILWGITDLFYKKGTDPNDKYSHLRIVFMVGLVMGVQAMFELHKMGLEYDLINIINTHQFHHVYLSMTLGA